MPGNNPEIKNNLAGIIREALMMRTTNQEPSDTEE
jgi:hypothetical protein